MKKCNGDGDMVHDGWEYSDNESPGLTDIVSLVLRNNLQESPDE